MAKLSRSLRVRAAGAAVLGAGLGLAACGSTSVPASPQAAIHDSLKSLTSQSGISIRISVPLTAAQVEQLAGDGGSGSSLTSKGAEAISTGSLFFEVSTGHGESLDSKQAATDKFINFDMGLTIGSTTPFEYRMVDQNIYLRASASDFDSDTGVNPSALSRLQSEAGEINAEVPGASALAAGQWVEISHSSLTSLLGLAKSLGAASASGAASNPASYTSEFARLRHDIAGDLQSNSEITKIGSSNGRTEYSVVTRLKPFLTQIGGTIQTDLASLPGGVGSKYAADVNRLGAKVTPGQLVTMDVYVQSNRLEEIDVNLEQFATGQKKMPFPVDVRVVVGSNPSISAPSGATNVDLSRLPALLGGLLSGSSSSSSASTATTSAG